MALPRWLTAPVGQAARTVGRAYDYATPGAGTSTLTNAGRSISDPNAVYTGGFGGLFNGHSDFSPVARAGNAGNPGGDSISQPQVLGAATYGGGGSGAATTNPQDASYWQDIINQLNGEVGQNNTARDQGLTTLGDSFNQSSSRLNEQRSNTLRDFGTSQDTLDTNRRQTINDINRGAENSTHSLLGLLASRGAGVSSAARYAVPDAISSYYGGQRGKAITNYGQQQRGLDTARTDATQAYTNAESDLTGQRKSKEQALRESALNTENDLLSRLSDATTKLKVAQGGTYTGGAGARQPFLDRIAANRQSINQLFDTYRNPTYSVSPVNASAPDISSYNTDPLSLDLAASGNPVDAPTTYLPFLQRDKNKGNLFAGAAA